ncbi:MAG TPA: tail fiber protein [Thermoanaerobaculia bacterium]
MSLDPIGEIRMVSFEDVPHGWARCDGSLLEIAAHRALYEAIGTAYGGDGETMFALPDLRGRVPLGEDARHPLGERGGAERIALDPGHLPAHTHAVFGTTARARDLLPNGCLLSVVPRKIYGEATELTALGENSVQPAGDGEPHENRQPYLALSFLISVAPREAGGPAVLAGEVTPFAGENPPPGFAPCDGQVLPVAEHEALSALVGARFGGDGERRFALPDLRGRAPLGCGQADPHRGYTLGEAGGAETVALAPGELARHTHPFRATRAAGTAADPSGKVLARSTSWNVYRPNVPDDPMNAAAIAPSCGIAPEAGAPPGPVAQPHDNMMPFRCVNLMIALAGTGAPPLGRIRLFAGGEVPPGHEVCDGRLLPIASHEELFAILGVTYGGDGRTSFALPDLRGRVPIHRGHGAGLTRRVLGEAGGAESVALSPEQVPRHAHALTGTHCPAVIGDPEGCSMAQAGYQRRADPLVELAKEALGSAGEGRAHANMQPYVSLRFVIAVRDAADNPNGPAEGHSQPELR